MASIETKNKQHDKKIPRNYATNILKKKGPKHTCFNKKLIFNNIAATEKIEKSNAAAPHPSSPDQETNIADNEYSTPITRDKGGQPKGSMLKIKRGIELSNTAVLKTVVSNFIK